MTTIMGWIYMEEKGAGKGNHPSEVLVMIEIYP